MEDIERMEVAFGLDPCEVLRPDDVMEKVVWKVATKCVNLLNSSGRMYNRAHVSSEFNYFGSNVWGHGWDCGEDPFQLREYNCYFFLPLPSKPNETPSAGSLESTS